MLLQVMPLIVALGGAVPPQPVAVPPQQARPVQAVDQSAKPAPSTPARPLLDAALAQAKREDKIVFLWFSAEW